MRRYHPCLEGRPGFFVAATLMVAGAADLVLFGAGRVITGFATGLLLIIAVPPIVRGFLTMDSPWPATSGPKIRKAGDEILIRVQEVGPPRHAPLPARCRTKRPAAARQ